MDEQHLEELREARARLFRRQQRAFGVYMRTITEVRCIVDQIDRYIDVHELVEHVKGNDTEAA